MRVLLDHLHARIRLHPADSRGKGEAGRPGADDDDLHGPESIMDRGATQPYQSCPMENRWTFTVEWGDCDAAGIVFYPNYFRWFDAAFQKLLRRKGLSQRELGARYGIIGTGLIDTGARFKGPAAYGDEVELVTHIERFEPLTFTAAHTVFKGGRVIVEGFEKRAFLSAGEGEGRLKALPVPEAFRSLFKSA